MALSEDPPRIAFMPPKKNVPVLIIPNGVNRPFAGATCMISRTADGGVLKWVRTRNTSDCNAVVARQSLRMEQEDTEILEREKRVYEVLAFHSHPNVLRCLDISALGTHLEYMEQGNLRDYLTQHTDTIGERQRLVWSHQAALGLQHLHDQDILWVDISARNCLVAGDLSLKLSDFGGSGLSGQEPLVMIEDSYDPRSEPCSIATEIFGLGSLYFEIATGKPPFTSEAPDLYPDLTGLAVGSVIDKCWTGKYKDCDAVGQDLEVPID